jgi:hypothetical protein
VHPSGQTVPVPIGTGTDSINQALAQGGITVKTIAGNDVEGGQAGDVLQVTSKHTIPVEGNPKGTFIYRIGGASTFILFGSAAPGLPAVPAPVENVGGDNTTAPPAGSTGAPTGGGSTSGSTGTGLDNSGSGLAGSYGTGSGSHSGGGLGSSSGAGLGDTSGVTGGAGAGSGSLSAAPTTGGTTQHAILARDVRGTTKFFYAVIGVAGAMLLASSALWRLKGVKAAWTS